MQRRATAMGRRVESALVAKVGACVFAAALGVPLMLPASRAQAAVMVADVVVTHDAVSTAYATDPIADELGSLRARLVARDAPVTAPTAPEPPPPPSEPLVSDGTVLASWYGPGFFGNRTACGQILTPETVGVAHRTLPCGTRVRITSPAGVTLVVPVIDRGPYVAGRALDLSSATKVALRCTDLCHVRMTVVH